MSNNRENKTRRERYQEKLKTSKILPISVVTVNFKHEVNLAYVIRAAVCFGAEAVYVIGAHPSRRIMNELSGSLFDYIKVQAFSNPSDFIRYTEQENISLVSVELPPDGLESHQITDYEFDFTQRLCLAVGHETQGVPTEILFKSKSIVYIKMHGAGFCLNTSQTANIALYEATKQYVSKKII